MTTLDALLTDLKASDGVDGPTLNRLVRESKRMEKALSYYADPGNWLDTEPMLTGPDGLLSVPDEGFTAQWALRQLDIILPIYIDATDAKGFAVAAKDDDEDDGQGGKTLVVPTAATPTPGGEPTKTLG